MWEDKSLKVHKDKYYGLYRGFVKDNKDPKNMGRLKLCIPSVYGVDNGEPLVTDWVYPAFPIAGQKYGIQCIPPTLNPDGSNVLVWVAFEMGDKNKPVWIGCPVSNNGLQQNVDANQTDKRKGKTTRSCFSFSSPMGHKIILDDQSGDIIIESSSGASITIGRNIILKSSSGEEYTV